MFHGYVGNKDFFSNFNNMDPEDQSPDLDGVVESVVQMFGEVMSRDAICAIVEHCAGDLTQAIDIIVNMSDDSSACELTNSLPTLSQTPESITITGSPYLNQNMQIPVAFNQTAGSSSNLTDFPLMSGSPRNAASFQNLPPTLSYSGASQVRGAFPKQLSIHKVSNTQISIWRPETQKLLDYHKQGSRTMILLRGLPGSGKSFLARELVQTMCPGMNYKIFVFSTDDFFMHRGRYQYNKVMLSEAHVWNQNRVLEAMRRGMSPIFVDNTNIEIWQMEYYVRAGVREGYIIEVLEPNTPWAKKVYQLARKNSHDVQMVTLRRLLDSFENCPSGAHLVKSFGLSYPADKVPPVKRSYPPFLEQNVTEPSQEQQSQVDDSPKAYTLKGSNVTQTFPYITGLLQQDVSSISQAEQATNYFHLSCQAQSVQASSNEALITTSQMDTSVPQSSSSELKVEPNIDKRPEPDAVSSIISKDTGIQPTDVNDPINKVEFVKLEDVRKQLEQIEKLEVEWDKSEAWNDETNTVNPSAAATAAPNENTTMFVPKPPRNSQVYSEEDRFLPPGSNYNDWSKISMFMPSWNENHPTNLLDTPNVEVETVTQGTSVEFGDTDVNRQNLKVLIATPRDINFYYMGLNEEKIPNKRMLDKSSMTNDHDHIATETFRCKNEEKHFIALRKLFKNISKVELRDIFDKCVGDVNWAVDIVLDGMANNQLHTVGSEDVSDTEDFSEEQCDCLAAYNIIPSTNTQPKPKTDESLTELGTSSPSLRLKKEKAPSESSIQLKRQIEQNVVISDSHYSNHCLKIRKMRRGEVNDAPGPVQEEDNSPIAASTTENALEAVATSYSNTDDDDDDRTTTSDDCERVVNVDLGKIFVSELDNMFGRSNMEYPSNISTRINMPVTLLNEINALWIESFMYQLDEQSRQSELMLRQDEEFARQLALKEEQLAKAGQEPAVPDLKDIMDMELALSIYKKEITAEWRNNEPNDLAARMTREKLYNLFPDVLPEILSELLMAHDNNFQATVEVLLSSTGNGHVLEEENGVTKFITTKELERHEKLIEEQKKALSEVEWPLLPKDVKVDMDTVQEYRVKASEHWEQRNKPEEEEILLWILTLKRRRIWVHEINKKRKHLGEKYLLRAESYLAKNMIQIASYYSDVAVLHKKRFDHANSLAAASLMQIHAANCTDKSTIDLHFMRVLEAKETLDLFLDTHIRKLRESQSRGPKFHTLFFITGRGLHSPGGPVIKPATKRRLRERGIGYTERNPGLLSSRVSAEDRLTHEIP